MEKADSLVAAETAESLRQAESEYAKVLEFNSTDERALGGLLEVHALQAQFARDEIDVSNVLGLAERDPAEAERLRRDFDNEASRARELALALRKPVRLGYDVEVAADGEEAVELFRKHAHEIMAVILDLTMPRMDGVATFDALRRISPDVKVILSSGYNETEATRRFAGHGLTAFIQKPYQLKSLSHELARVLDACSKDST